MAIIAKANTTVIGVMEVSRMKVTNLDYVR